MDFTCAAVLFDADGTLIDSIPAVERAWRTWSAEYGFDADTKYHVCTAPFESSSVPRIRRWRE